MKIKNNSYVSESLKIQSPSQSQPVERQLLMNKKSISETDNNKKDLNKNELPQAVEKLSKAIEPFQEDIRFVYNKEADRVMVKVINIHTGEVVKEIPPQEIIDMIARIRQFIGLIIDKKI